MEHEQRTDRFTALEDYFSGYEVYDPAHSKIGKVGDLFVDENHEPEYVSVKTGFLGTKSTLIPWQIVEVRDEEQRLVVAADKDAVKGGSAFNDCEITPEYENEVHSYYGLEGTRASEVRGLYGGHFGHSEGEHPSEVRPGTRLGDT
jgi:PRC-barrel domain